MHRYLKPAIFVGCLLPFVWLVVQAVSDGLGANPIDAITDTTGTWALRFVLATLAVTPLRRLTGWNAIIRVRRMLGLFAFFYATMHFATWLVLDQFFAWEFILADIAKRPFITMGFTAFVLMIPLAITSTTGWIRRLGGRTWNRLHRLIYVTGVAAVIHYLWLVKVIEPEQIAYAVILGLLLGMRIYYALVRERRRVPAGAVKSEV